MGIVHILNRDTRFDERHYIYKYNRTLVVVRLMDYFTFVPAKYFTVQVFAQTIITLLKHRGINKYVIQQGYDGAC
ncbi:hypothetical protein PR048_001597 [Dryococelus australis]|uniref:Integrase catalytic domain-containing protein n=1 Tax=Dryococelus australis TaxID=614101 RepID=A0ABQ9IHQ7_9NEOP|nr:hypothetical protein PR048_001597 [Dryococelus australis]